MKFKEIFGMILVIGSMICLLICLILSMVFYFKNPDMTDLRRFIENPEPAIGAIICLIVGKIGISLLGNNKY